MATPQSTEYKVLEAKKAGRPLKFKTAHELQGKIDEYFKLCQEDGLPFTMSGLALSMDTDRQTLINYSKNEVFFGTIKRARNMVEASIESRALAGRANPAFSIFNLKNNFGWKDKTELDVSSMNVNLEATVDQDTLQNFAQFMKRQ